MTEVMDAHVFEVGPGPDAPPGVLKIGEMAVGLLACDHPGVVVVAGQGFKQPHGRGRQRHRPPASFRVRRVQLARVEVDMLPPQLLDLR